MPSLPSAQVAVILSSSPGNVLSLRRPPAKGVEEKEGWDEDEDEDEDVDDKDVGRGSEPTVVSV